MTPNDLPQKHPDKRQGHRAPVQLRALPAPTKAKAPTVPRDLLPESRKRWRELWRSPVARLWDRDTDLGVLTRYIKTFDRWLRADAIVAKHPLTRGSRRQLRTNPLATGLGDLSRQLLAMEDRIGLTPVARIRLGIDALEGAKTWAELERELDDDSEEIERQMREETTPFEDAIDV